MATGVAADGGPPLQKGILPSARMGWQIWSRLPLVAVQAAESSGATIALIMDHPFEVASALEALGKAAYDGAKLAIQEQKSLKEIGNGAMYSVQNVLEIAKLTPNTTQKLTQHATDGVKSGVAGVTEPSPARLGQAGVDGGKATADAGTAITSAPKEAFNAVKGAVKSAAEAVSIPIKAPRKTAKATVSSAKGARGLLKLRNAAPDETSSAIKAVTLIGTEMGQAVGSAWTAAKMLPMGAAVQYPVAVLLVLPVLLAAFLGSIWGTVTVGLDRVCQRVDDAVTPCIKAAAGCVAWRVEASQTTTYDDPSAQASMPNFPHALARELRATANFDDDDDAISNYTSHSEQPQEQEPHGVVDKTKAAIGRVFGRSSSKDVEDEGRDDNNSATNSNGNTATDSSKAAVERREQVPASNPEVAPQQTSSSASTTKKVKSKAKQAFNKMAFWKRSAPKVGQNSKKQAPYNPSTVIVTNNMVNTTPSAHYTATSRIPIPQADSATGSAARTQLLDQQVAPVSTTSSNLRSNIPSTTQYSKYEDVSTKNRGAQQNVDSTAPSEVEDEEEDGYMWRSHGGLIHTDNGLPLLPLLALGLPQNVAADHATATNERFNAVQPPIPNLWGSKTEGRDDLAFKSADELAAEKQSSQYTNVSNLAAQENFERRAREADIRGDEARAKAKADALSAQEDIANAGLLQTPPRSRPFVQDSAQTTPEPSQPGQPTQYLKGDFSTVADRKPAFTATGNLPSTYTTTSTLSPKVLDVNQAYTTDVKAATPTTSVPYTPNYNFPQYNISGPTTGQVSSSYVPVASIGTAGPAVPSLVAPVVATVPVTVPAPRPTPLNLNQDVGLGLRHQQELPVSGSGAARVATAADAAVQQANANASLPSRVANTASNVVSNVQNTAANVVSNIQNTAANVVNNVNTTASNVADNARSTASAVQGTVVDKVNAVQSQVANTASSAANSATASNVAKAAKRTQLTALETFEMAVSALTAFWYALLGSAYAIAEPLWQLHLPLRERLFRSGALAFQPAVLLAYTLITLWHTVPWRVRAVAPYILTAWAVWTLWSEPSAARCHCPTVMPPMALANQCPACPVAH
jgi:hypothetical protein